MPHRFVTFTVQQNATTASPDLATQIISPSPALRAKTRAVVLKPEGKGLVVELYRDSTTAPGWWSCDVYPVVAGKLGPHKERREKCAPSQVPPPGAKCRVIDGVAYYTMSDMSDAEAEELRRLVAELALP